MFPTLEDIQSAYPDAMTADMNEGLVRKWLEELPEYKKTVTAWDDGQFSHINSYVGDDVIETDEHYPQCNYCVGGALQMALGETEPSIRDDWREGIFPSSDILADTIHYYCYIPYSGRDAESGNVLRDENDLASTNPCPFPQHEGKDCLMQFPNDVNDGAFELADNITRANDRGDFDEAWSYVEFVLKLGRKNLKENK